MKRTLLTILSVLFCAITFAQSVPQGINYQAVARDASGAVLMNQALTIQFSVISDITTSAVSWQETHTVNTNDYGLYTAIIGQGTATSVGSSASFDVIDWGASNHLLKVEVDFGGGIFVDMGTTAFMSVPYSLNVDPTDELQSLSISGDTISISNGNFVVLDIECFVAGCTDSNACNYNSSACYNNGSCISALYGCTDSTALNYDVNATCDDGSCIVVVLGCTDSTAYSGYNPLANTDDGSCIAVVNGCTDSTAYSGYNPLANTDDGSCVAVALGCTDSTAFNYNVSANTDDGSCRYTPLIGDTYGGGIIFWLDGNGGGLIAAPSNQSSGAQWGCYGTNITGAGGTAIGTGTQNTIDIINANCTSSNGSPTAADICANLTLGGYSDWFLPSKDELNEMYLNQTAIGGFSTNGYWSSSEGSGGNQAWKHYFWGHVNGDWKNNNSKVRAVRAFTSNNVLGCTDSTAFNYNASANTDDGSCIAVVLGCTDSTASS